MAAKSIVQIEVDDEQFKAFQALWSKYQTELSAQAGKWSATEEAVGDMSGHFAKMTAAMLAQAEILHRQNVEREKAEKNEAAADKSRTAAQKAEAKAARDRAQASKKMVADSKAIAKSVADTTIHLLKWASLGTIFAGLAGAGGLFGLDRLADSVGNARRSAQGLGITAGQQQAFGINFGRYVDPNANLENIAEAKSDYAKRWAFSAMGVNPVGKDSAQLAVEMLTRAKEIFDRGDQSQQSAQAHGLLQFYTMDELRRLHATSMRDLQDSGAGYGRDVRAISLQDDVQKRWQDFGVQMHRAGLQIESVFVRGLTPLVPELTKLSDAFANAVGDFLANPHMKEWLEDAAQGIGAFAKYLGSDKFQSDMRNLVDDVSALAEAIVKALRWLSLIPDNGPSAGRPPVQSAGGAIVKGAFAGATGNFGKLQASQFGAFGAQMSYFMGQGWTEAQAAGIVSNLYSESRLNPGAVGDHGKAYGIGQWHEDRQAIFKKVYGKDIRGSSLDEQRAFVQYELTHNEAAAGARLRAVNDPGAAAGAVSRFYERPKDPLGFEAAGRGWQASDLMREVDKHSFNDIRATAAALRATHAKTLSEVISEYDKGKKDLAAEIRDVAKSSGIGASQAVDLNDTNTVAKLVAAIQGRKNPGAGPSQQAVVTVLNNTGGSAVVSTNQIAR